VHLSATQLPEKSKLTHGSKSLSILQPAENQSQIAQETSETHTHNSLGLKDLKIQGKTQEALQD
jgi:hypothetical protein